MNQELERPKRTSSMPLCVECRKWFGESRFEGLCFICHEKLKEQEKQK